MTADQPDPPISPEFETPSNAPDRNLAMELVRVTEAAAMAAGRWVGRGDKEGADGAAVDAMRLALGSVQMDGTVIIGEGEKDEAPMLYNGERIGDGSPPAVDIAVDPVDGTTLTAKGRGNAVAGVTWTAPDNAESAAVDGYRVLLGHPERSPL